MKTKLLCFSLLMLAIGGSLFGQTLTPAGSSTGSITTNAANCNTTNACIILHLASSNVGYSVTVSSTWTGTLTIEQSGDNQGSWTSATTTTANTLYTSALTPGITDVRVRGSAAMTGTAVVTITASGPATLQQITQAVGSSSASPSNNAVNATSYGVVADAHHSSVAVITNTSNIVTAADGNFTGLDNLNRPIAKVGQKFFCTNATTDVSQNTSTVILAETTILSIDSATQVHTVGSATASSNPGTCAWGDLDSAPFGSVQTIANDPLFAAWTAAANNCLPLQLPAGEMLIEQPEFNTFPAVGGCGNANSTTISRRGFAVNGLGPNATIIIVMPSLLAANCNGPNAVGVGCYFSAPSMYISNLQLWGLGNSAPGAGFSGKYFVYISGVSPGVNFGIFNVFIFGFGANQSGFRGLSINNGTSLGVSGGWVSHSIIENAGGIQCYVDAPSSPAALIYFDTTWCYGGNQDALVIVNGAVGSTNGLYGGNSGVFNINGTPGPAVSIQNGSTMYSTNDQLTYNSGTGGSPQFFVTGPNTSLKIANDVISQPQAGGSGIYVHLGGKVTIADSVIAAPFTIFTGNGGTCTTTCSVKSLGGNDWTATTTGWTAATGSAFLPAPTDTFTGFANTVVSVSSGFGTSPSIATNSVPAAFTVNVGTGGTATNGVIGLPPAPTGWVCNPQDITTQSATVFITKQIATTVSTVTIANFNTAGAQAAWAASDIVHVSCEPR